MLDTLRINLCDKIIGGGGDGVASGMEGGGGAGSNRGRGEGGQPEIGKTEGGLTPLSSWRHRKLRESGVTGGGWEGVGGGEVGGL